MLDSVCIGIKTFLRDHKLFNTIQAIRDTMPEVKMIVADCGYMTEEKDGIYADLEREGHKVIHLPFDAGFGAMSNAIVKALDRDYLLIGSDDFDFKPCVREGVERLQRVVSTNFVDIASGRVRGPYEFNLTDLGDTIIEHKIKYYPINLNRDPNFFVYCDLTVNYSMIHACVFNSIRWDDDVKIGGGEHGAFFVDVKRAGFKVAYVPGVGIQEQGGEDSAEYHQYRARAASPERPCFVKRGIRQYVLGNGLVDYNDRVTA